MTIPTPTEGIEPTIRRIAEEVSREYLGNILGLCLGKQKAPQEPADPKGDSSAEGVAGEVEWREGEARVPLAPAEARGAPEQARFLQDDDGYWIETRDESETATVFVPADVVNRRSAAEWKELHAALGSPESVSVLDGVRHVVAERDAAEAKAKAAESELTRVRAELAEEQQKRRDSDRVSLEQLNMILTAREALELWRPK